MKSVGWSLKEYWAIPEDGARHEVLDGVLLREPPPTADHQAVVRELFVALATRLGRDGRRGLYTAPIAVVLSDDTVVEPDLVYVRPDRSALIQSKGIYGSPDLVVEVLSPSSRERDLIAKRHVYARHGIAEYWIVDPDARQIYVCTDPDGGRYVRVSPLRAGEEWTSRAVPGFTLVVDQVFQSDSGTSA